MNVAERLQEKGIQPSAHRVAVASYVLVTDEHPSADLVWKRVREGFPQISRATVYNTLNLFVDKGLLRELNLDPDRVVFDPIMVTHHHFIDEESGSIHDVPWDRLQVNNLEGLEDYEIDDYMVVMRGRKKSAVSSQ